MCPAESRWTRHLLRVRASARAGHLPLAVFLDAAAGSRPTATVGAAQVGLHDVPIGLGGVVRMCEGSFVLEAGPRACLHVFDADGTSADGRSGTLRRYVLGAGVLGGAR